MDGDSPALIVLTEEAKAVADMWEAEPEEMKTYWTGKAKEEELQHKGKYPEYQFAGNKMKTPMKRKAPISHSSSPPHKNAKHDMAEQL